jgi:hypothetical protein
MNPSQNGDGKSRTPINRIAAVATKPATPADEHENQIIAALAGRYNQLDALWQHAEEDLKRFRLHSVVATAPFKSFPLLENDFDGKGPHEYHFLGFLRCGKSWRICYGVSQHMPSGDEDEPHWTPISDCSVDVRIEAIPVFEELRKKVVETAEQSVPKLDTALDTFRGILSR